MATGRYLQEGLTSVTDAGVADGWIGHSPQEFGAYQFALEQGLLRTRMQPMITIDALQELSGHADDPETVGFDTGLRTGLGDEWLQIGPVKVFTDGSLLGSTAARTEDYEQCAGNHGYLLGNLEELREKVLGAAAAVWSLALHAIGDHAVDFAIDTIVRAQKAVGLPAIPNRIEHGGVVREDQLARLAEYHSALAARGCLRRVCWPTLSCFLTTSPRCKVTASPVLRWLPPLSAVKSATAPCVKAHRATMDRCREKRTTMGCVLPGTLRVK